MRRLILAALAATLLPAGAHAWESGNSWQPMIYSYETKHNFCPAGLQPITLNGVVCCGTPNQGQSYQQALRHPVVKKKKTVYHAPRRSYSATQYSKSPQGNW